MVTTDWNRVLACSGRAPKWQRESERIGNAPKKQKKVVVLKKGEREKLSLKRRVEKYLRKNNLV